VPKVGNGDDVEKVGRKKGRKAAKQELAEREGGTGGGAVKFLHPRPELMWALMHPENARADCLTILSIVVCFSRSKVPRFLSKSIANLAFNSMICLPVSRILVSQSPVLDWLGILKRSVGVF
jgi:hypothetical protein